MRILFVAMANSVHTARWVKQLAGTGWDLHVFDALQGTTSPELTGVTAHVWLKPPDGKSNAPVEWIVPAPMWKGQLRTKIPPLAPYLRDPTRIESLVQLIRRLQPDVIHSLEMQHESYPLLEVRKALGPAFTAPWVYSCWGSDLYHFRNQPEHADRIREVLAACDYLTTDCRRDIGIARELGFTGDALGVFPGAGGFHTAEMRARIAAGPVAARRTIAVKGYHNWAGRAVDVLQAIHQCVDVLGGYRIVVYSADPEAKHVAQYIARITDLEIEVLPQSPHARIIELMGSSRLAIASSISDGTPNSMLEAMVMGAFPIQSDTVSTQEWIEDGVNGILVQPDDVTAIERAIRRALADDALMESAAAHNARLTEEQIDWSAVQPRVVDAYQRVVARGRKCAPCGVDRPEQQG